MGREKEERKKEEGLGLLLLLWHLSLWDMALLRLFHPNSIVLCRQAFSTRKKEKLAFALLALPPGVEESLSPLERLFVVCAFMHVGGKQNSLL